MHRHHPLFAPLIAIFLTACGAGSGPVAGEWAGAVDTLASGQIVVTNPAVPSWAPGEEWRVVEEVRIGSLDGDGPDLFGNVRSLTVDDGGRIWVLEEQAQELRVFSAEGEHIRTVGRRGGGPGEFAGALHIDRAPDGNLWVIDPRNNRVSVFDTAGVYLEERRVPGGFVIIPWPGGFDEEGRYYGPALSFGDSVETVRVRYDAAMLPLDTLRPPTDPITRERFRVEQDGGSRGTIGVPFQGGLETRTAPSGRFWSLLTDEYRLTEFGEAGDTLRTITRAFEPIRVSAEERREAIEGLEWFAEMGGRIDPSKIPSTRPLAGPFFFDELGHIWVSTTPAGREGGWTFDIFDPEGRYLGPVELPFALQSWWLAPVFRDGMLYGVTVDEFEVQYVVAARVER